MAVPTVNVATLKQWLDKGEAVLVDVREPGEYNAEHIDGATLLPLASVSRNALPTFSGKKLVIQCRSGRRSEQACNAIQAEDQNVDLYNLEGGILAWKEAGYPISASGKFFLPLDRQVQLTIGSCVLIFSTLGLLMHMPFFFWLTGFFGCGVVMAGLTGFCPLAAMIAKMPWNQGNAVTTCTPQS